MNYKTHTITTLTATSFLTLYTPIEATVPLFIGAALGGLFPDIDEPNSFIGQKNTVKIFNKRFGLSSLIKSIFGHRGLTHSILAMIVAFIPYFYLTDYSSLDTNSLLYLLCSQFLLGFGFGYIFHILGDLITVQGVPLFLPFSKVKIKIPLFYVNSPTEKFVFFLSGLLLIYSIYLHISNFVTQI